MYTLLLIITLTYTTRKGTPLKDKLSDPVHDIWCTADSTLKPQTTKVIMSRSEQAIQFYQDNNKQVFIPSYNSIAKSCSSVIHFVFMTLSLLPLRYVISTCLTEITRVYQAEVTSLCPSSHINVSKAVTVGVVWIYFLSGSLGL